MASYSVVIMDMFNYGDEWRCTGFPTAELAREFARRWVRDSVEELREPGMSAKALRAKWHMFGESALTAGYRASEEIDYFCKNLATAEERDYRSIMKEAGIPVAS